MVTGARWGKEGVPVPVVPTWPSAWAYEFALPATAAKRQRRDAIMPVFGLGCRLDQEELIRHRRNRQTLRYQQDARARLFLDQGSKMLGHIVELL